MILCLFLFLHEDWYSRLTGNIDLRRQHLGDIGYAKDDVRYKRGSSFDWQRSVGINQKIFAGDAVFCGPNSRASVRLNSKNDIQIGENSLVRFTNHRGMTLSDLVAGKFRLQVDGQVQVAINGTLTTLKGDKSEVQVFFDEDKKPKLKLLKGEVRVSTEKLHASAPPTKAKKVSSAKSIALADVQLTEAKPLIIAQATPSPVVEMPPQSEPTEQIVRYPWKLQDLYSMGARAWNLRADRPSTVDIPQMLTWKDIQPGPYKLQISPSSTFDSVTTLQRETSARQLQVSKLQLGDNFWRVSRDGELWSDTQRFTVIPEFTGTRPQFKDREITAWLVHGPASVRLEWNTSPELASYVLEGSNNGEFAPNNTLVSWKQTGSWKGTFNTPGIYYFRVRGANARTEATDYSEILKVNVVVPPLLAQPQLPRGNLEFTESSNGRLKWVGPRGARAYSLKVTDDNGRVIQEKTLSESETKIAQLPVGRFRYQVTAIDRWGRAGQSSEDKQFKINKLALNSAPQRTVANQPTPTPEPLAEEEPSAQPPAQIATKAKKVEREPEFSEYNASLFQVEGASGGLISSEQLTYDQGTPLMATVGLRNFHWWKRFGVESAAKMKVFSYNSEAEGAAPTQVEARLHHRWTSALSWFSFLREIQASVFGGLEV